MLTDTENTLYVLQTLSSTDSVDLEWAEIDVYYEDEQGNEGAAQYDMPTIADDAIKTIERLQSALEERDATVAALRAQVENKWISGESTPDEAEKYYLVAIRNQNKFGLIYEVAYLNKKFCWHTNKNGYVESWMMIPPELLESEK